MKLYLVTLVFMLALSAMSGGCVLKSYAHEPIPYTAAKALEKMLINEDDLTKYNILKEPSHPKNGTGKEFFYQIMQCDNMKIVAKAVHARFPELNVDSILKKVVRKIKEANLKEGAKCKFGVEFKLEAFVRVDLK